MSSIKAILITALTGLAAASPIMPRQNNTSTASTTLSPVTLSQWNAGTSRVTYDTSIGRVSRTPGSTNEISTLHTFNVPSQYAGRTCALTFSLLNPESSVSGTGKAQLFFDNLPPRAGATSNNRDRQIGGLQVVNGGSAVFTKEDGTVVGSSARLPCSDLIARPYLEIAPQGERVAIAWPRGDGLKVTVLDA